MTHRVKFESLVSCALCALLCSSCGKSGEVSSATVPAVRDLQAHWDSGTAGQFSGVDNVPIHYRSFVKNDQKGAVVICSGRTECMLKYQEVVWELGKDYSVYILDHRGQGFSGRMLEDKQIGHVESFEDYVTDFKTFVDTVVLESQKDLPAPAKSTPLLLLAHSMGGCIASLYLENNADHSFTAVVLCSPMHKPDTGLVPEFVAKVFTGDAKEWLGKKDENATGKLYADVAFDDVEDQESGAMTHSKVRYERTRTLYNANPEVKIGGPSYQWAHEALDAATRARNDAGKIVIPVLLLQAGNDAAVDNDGQVEFAEGVPSCERFEIKDAYHELLVERDDYRNQAMAKIRHFFDNAPSRP